MTYPSLGYEPGVGNRPPGTLAPGSVEQWAHDFAISQANRLANGTIDGSATGLFNNETAAQFGMNTFDPSDIGSGMVSAAAYNQLYNMGLQLANGGYNQLTPQQRQGLSDPTGLARGTTPLDETDRNNIAAGARQASANATDLAIANLTEAGATQRQAADIAARLSIAQLQEAGASTRNAAQILSNEKIAGIESADRRYSTDVNAAVNREDIAARERIAGADRTSREGIADKDRVESGRQFDLGLGEDRRQFNASMMFELFDRGIELMKNPVDWLGYQYWLGNIGAPLNALTLSSAAAMGGAIPPSGPSAAGPVIGGPAVLDGDFSGAESLGIQNAGPVTIAEAIQMHPGGSVTGDMEFAASTYAQAFGGVEAMDQALAQTRSTELEGQVSPQFMQQAQQVSAPIVQAQQMNTLAAGPGAAGQTSPVGAGVIPENEPGWISPPPGGTAVSQKPGAGATVPPAGAINPAAGFMAPVDELAPPVPGAVAVPGGVVDAGAVGPPPATPFTSIAPNVAGGGQVGGVYTGNEAGGFETAAPMVAGAATPASAESTAAAGAPATDRSGIEQLLAALASQLGIPIEQLRTMFPAQLMPGAASNSAIENSPVIQALRGNATPSAFNTGPTSGSPFTSIAAPTGGGRIETGIRGGQDVNATTFLTANPGIREQMQGVIRAQGQYLPDFQEQLLRSSPITNVSAGSYGRRSFGR